MKRVVLVAVASVFVLGLSSCKKDWVCVCIDKYGSDSEIYPNTSRQAAKTACQLDETHMKQYDKDASCELK